MIEELLPVKYVNISMTVKTLWLPGLFAGHFLLRTSSFARRWKHLKNRRIGLNLSERSDGVSYYDDSKGTNIDAVIQAVNAMTGPVILIAGGVDKGASYLLWKEHFSDKVKTIIAIGEAAPKIYRELHPYYNIKQADSLSSAVEAAAGEAEKGRLCSSLPGMLKF